ncbi:MAG: LicD family protein [Lachnospiraceae bacterium]|nr:LicD family protein [Lachnospiraceae bacterium]
MSEFSLLPETRCGFKVSEKRKKIWKVELDLIREFQRVCEKYNLRYFASNGTLLGIVRHHGFIPWDDDVDIVMPRPDYDKLLQVAGTEFSSPYILHTADTGHNYYRNYARLRNTATTAMPYRDWNRGDCCNGIFIDLFPLNGCAEPPVRWAGQKFLLRLLTAMANTYTYYPDFSGGKPMRKLLYQCAALFCHFQGYERLLETIHEISCWENYEEAAKVYEITHENKFFPFPADYYKESLWMNFENIKLPVPKAYDAI